MAYPAPTVTDFRARFSEFASVPDDTVQYWLDDAAPRIGQNWTAYDYPVGVMLLAAHNMARGGLLASSGGGIDVPAGVTQLRSGSLSISIDPAAAAQSATGGFASTKYGQELLLLTRQNVGGTRVTDGGEVVGVWGGYLSGLHPSW